MEAAIAIAAAAETPVSARGSARSGRKRTAVNYAADAGYDSSGVSVSQSVADPSELADSGSEFGPAASDEDDAEEDDDDDFADSQPPPAKRNKTPAAAAAEGKKKKAPAAAAAKPRAAPAAKKSKGSAASVGGSTTTKSPAKTAAKAKKVKQLSEKDATPVIFEYVQKQNRPYNAVQVFENLHKTIKLPTCKKVLDKLADADRLKIKVNGKQRYYYPDQSQYTDVSAEAVKEAEAVVKAKDAEFNEWNGKAIALERQGDSMSKELTDEELHARVATLEVENKELAEKVARLEGLGQSADPEKKKALVAEVNKWKRIWKQRRTTVVDVVDGILESMETRKTRDQFMEEMGLETDASAGVELRTFVP
uniref:Homologous-pairing protein 2 winged helix domain-containing protein n=1 Tax=Bicosoecida sp. CB-2014 TaxID=1486930 RepID=A0A7S1GDL9_9STRA